VQRCFERSRLTGLDTSGSWKSRWSRAGRAGDSGKSCRADNPLRGLSACVQQARVDVKGSSLVPSHTSISFQRSRAVSCQGGGAPGRVLGGGFAGKAAGRSACSVHLQGVGARLNVRVYDSSLTQLNMRAGQPGGHARHPAAARSSTCSRGHARCWSCRGGAIKLDEAWLRSCPPATRM